MKNLICKYLNFDDIHVIVYFSDLKGQGQVWYVK